ncbi:MAG: sugar kinase [Pseudomonadota bacterium]
MVENAPLLVAAGECMAEVSGPQGARHLGFGGDTLNTALLASRLLGPRRVAYMTRLGDDRYSASMMKAWADEEIDTTLVEVVPGETVGLYVIETEPGGDRSFTYWRRSAPARGLMTEGNWQQRIEAIAHAPAVYVSGITLAVLPATGRRRLIEALGKARAAGALVAVDPNYRPRLWSAEDARPWIADAYRTACLVLTSADEEEVLFGPGDPFLRLSEFGVRVGVLKGGSGVVRMMDENGISERPPLPGPPPIDTTGAGDAFNAGFLATLIAKRSESDALSAGLDLASTTIQHTGAIPPRDAMVECPH